MSTPLTPIQVGDFTTHFPLSPHTPGPLLISHLFLLTLLEFGIVYLIMLFVLHPVFHLSPGLSLSLCLTYDLVSLAFFFLPLPCVHNFISLLHMFSITFYYII